MFLEGNDKELDTEQLFDLLEIYVMCIWGFHTIVSGGLKRLLFVLIEYHKCLLNNLWRGT